MPFTALLAVLLAAFTHASWNLVAKRAAASRHFVWLYSLASMFFWTLPALWVLAHSHWVPGPRPLLALAATCGLHLAYSLALQAGYRTGDLSLVYPIARGSGPLLSFIGAALLLGERLRPGQWVAVAIAALLLIAFLIFWAVLFTGSHRGDIALSNATGGAVATVSVKTTSTVAEVEANSPAKSASPQPAGGSRCPVKRIDSAPNR